MKEFPVDNDPTSPAAPTSVATETLTPGGSGRTSTAGISSKTPLPPGLDRSALAQRADSMTTATYQPRQTTPASGTTPTTTAGGQVIVIVLNLLPNSGGAADAIAGTVAQASGGDATGITVQSPNGAAYTGRRIKTPQICVYVLQKQDDSVAIIVFAPDPAAQQLADRLAQNVGNGEGLNDYPDVNSSLASLPATLPSDLKLEEINTLTRNQIESSLAGSAGTSGQEDVGRILEQMRNFIPERLTAIRYSDASRQEWNALQFEYGSSFQAWRTWLLARGALGLSGSQSTTVREVDGLYIDQDGQRILIFQKGPYLMVLGSPSSVPVERLVALGNQFQV
jgi:hypothetical protein